MEMKIRVAIVDILIFYFDDALYIQEQKLMFSQSKESESQAKYNLDTVTQKTVHYPDNNNMSSNEMFNEEQWDLSF